MFKTSCAIWILTTVLAVGISQDIDDNDVILNKMCDTKNYKNGTCIVLSECKQAMELLKLGDFKSVNSIHCGFSGNNAKVCCPNTNNTLKDQIVFDENNGKEPFMTTNLSSSDTNISSTKSTTAASTTITNNTAALDVTTSGPMLPNNKLDNKSKATNQFYEDTFRPSVINDTSDDFMKILPDRNTCGLFLVQDRIYGGVLASLDEFPWLARIKYKNSFDQEVYACVGSLINDRYILTVAHCVANLTLINVRLGEWDEATEIDCSEGVCSDPPVDVEIDKAIMHPGYSARTKTNDIALLRLAQSINYTDFIRPVCLPTTSYIIEQDYVPETWYTIAGWGMTEYGSKSAVKRKLRLKTVAMTDCRLVFPFVTDTMAQTTICAGGRKDEDTCQGDSGGSLVRPVPENYQINWYLYGLTSFGIKACGTEGKPTLYTRVTRYMDWVKDNIQRG